MKSSDANLKFSSRMIIFLSSLYI